MNLYNRLLDYHQPAYLVSHPNFMITRAILKYGIRLFTIVLLEYTSREDVRVAEQAWIDCIQPEYNILKLVNSSLGFTHSEQGRLKISNAITGKKHTDEHRAAQKARQTGAGNTFFGKTHSEEAKAILRLHAVSRKVSHKPSIAIEVQDTRRGILTSFPSLRKAGEALGISYNTIKKYNGKLYSQRYLIALVNKPKFPPTY